MEIADHQKHFFDFFVVRKVVFDPNPDTPDLNSLNPNYQITLANESNVWKWRLTFKPKRLHSLRVDALHLPNRPLVNLRTHPTKKTKAGAKQALNVDLLLNTDPSDPNLGFVDSSSISFDTLGCSYDNLQSYINDFATGATFPSTAITLSYKLDGVKRKLLLKHDLPGNYLWFRVDPVSDHLRLLGLDYARGGQWVGPIASTGWWASDCFPKLYPGRVIYCQSVLSQYLGGQNFSRLFSSDGAGMIAAFPISDATIWVDAVKGPALISAGNQFLDFLQDNPIANDELYNTKFSFVWNNDNPNRPIWEDVFTDTSLLDLQRDPPIIFFTFLEKREQSHFDLVKQINQAKKRLKKDK